MAGQKEVEIKFLVDDSRALERKLRAAGFRRKTPSTREMNTLYDLPNEHLRRRGELLRLRQYGKKWKLTHKSKGQSGRHKSRAETEVEIPEGKKMDAILRAIGFAPHFHYEKFRAEYGDGEGDVVLDRTPIGTLAEIEGKPRWIDRTAKKLGLDRKQYITKNYVDLFLDWKKRTGSAAKEMTFSAVRKSKRRRR